MLMDGEQWAMRFRSAVVSHYRFLITGALLGWMGGAILLFIISSGAAGIEYYAAMFIALVIFFPFFHTLVDLAGLRMGLRRIGEGQGVPGLYSNGIQTFVNPSGGGLFIPYKEIVEVKQRRLFFLDMFDIFVMGRWTSATRLPREFLGEKGMAVLLEMSGRRPSPAAPA